MERKEYKKNDIIFKEGEKEGYFYLFLDGSVNVIKNIIDSASNETEQVHLVTLKAGSIAGECVLVINWMYIRFI
jgi:CRP-like cAMP-binding protein